MDGIKKIMDGVREMMNELFDGVREENGILRSFAEHIGVMDINAVVETLLEGGMNKDFPYPVLHFHITLASDIPSEQDEKLAVSLNILNNVISVGEFPSFGCFAYYPDLGQVYLTYRLPVNPDDPEGELVNIRYYFAVLYEELDMFADYIMFIINNDGTAPDIMSYLDYLKGIAEWDDIEKRSEELSKLINDTMDEIKAGGNE